MLRQKVLLKLSSVILKRVTDSAGPNITKSKSFIAGFLLTNFRLGGGKELVSFK